MSPTVSVGIPTFQRAQLMRQAILSVLQQTYQDFEIVVVDDCSSDDTADVVASIADARIKYFRNPSTVGVPRNWNECVRRARGEFFALLPDDDVFCQGFLAEMLGVLGTHPDVAFAQCAFYRVDEQLRPIDTISASTSELTLAGEKALIWQMTTLRCNPVSLLFRRSAMLAMGLWREDYWDDWAFIVRMAYRLGFTFVPKPLAANRTHGYNLSRVLANQGRDEVLDLINQQSDVFGEALPATPAILSLRAGLSREVSHHCVLKTLKALLRGDCGRAIFHLRRGRHLYALAGIDPGFLRMGLGHKLGILCMRIRQKAARSREPIVNLESAARA